MQWISECLEVACGQVLAGDWSVSPWVAWAKDSGVARSVAGILQICLLMGFQPNRQLLSKPHPHAAPCDRHLL